ncbi:MAG: transcription termination/antitermination protein NusA [Acidobacteria bacterium]|nr:transcription termination/antitermination protein NusA [Acidobacteriota bacterium]
MNGELLRQVDAIRREKNIDAEIVFLGIEAALVSAAKKHLGTEQDIVITIDRATGGIAATLSGQPMDPPTLGRIAAQTAKQVIIQKIRDAERASLMEDYADQIGTIISGQVTRIEHGNAVVGLGRGEGFLPRSEQVPGETLHVGDRIRALIIEVREAGANVKIVLSRIHPDLIIRLFELEVPEVADGVIEVEAIAREPGHRTKVAVTSTDTRVDAVGACVGIRGSRIKNIVEEVAGEKIDIVRYNESPQVFIANALKPAEVKEILLNRDINRATVLVAEDQLSLAIGKKGQNVRLAARLSGWNIDILTPGEYDEQRATAIEQLAGVEAVGPDLANDLIAAGYISLADVAEVDPETLSRIAGVDNETARDIIVQVGVLVADLEAHAAEREARKAAEAAAEGEAGAEPAGEDEADAEPAGEDDADAAPAGEDDADAANLDVAPDESDTTEPSPGEPGQAGTHEPQSQEAAAEAAADTPAGTDADAADGTDPEAAPQA